MAHASFQFLSEHVGLFELLQSQLLGIAVSLATLYSSHSTIELHTVHLTNVSNANLCVPNLGL